LLTQANRTPALATTRRATAPTRRFGLKARQESSSSWRCRRAGIVGELGTLSRLAACRLLPVWRRHAQPDRERSTSSRAGLDHRVNLPRTRTDQKPICRWICEGERRDSNPRPPDHNQELPSHVGHTGDGGQVDTTAARLASGEHAGTRPLLQVGEEIGPYLDPAQSRAIAPSSCGPPHVRRFLRSGRLDLNQRPFDPQSNALPSCATPRMLRRP
jgi:hypothetical protein